MTRIEDSIQSRIGQLCMLREQCLKRFQINSTQIRNRNRK